MIEKDEYLQQSVIGDTLKMTFGYRRKHTLKKMKKADGMVSMIKKSLQKDWQLYLLVLPTLIYVIIFNYIPMYGLRIAFEDYNPSMGFAASEFVGLKHFLKFFNSYKFWPVMRNTFVLGFYGLIAGFFPPIILAVLLHNTMNKRFKSFFQTISYAPHFISVVVMAGMVILLLSPSSGVVNAIIAKLGGDKINFMADADLFPHIYVWSSVWQGTGWGTIIYLSALAGADPQLYEAATLDGASKLQRIIHLDIPTLMPTAVIMLILNSGNVLTCNTQKVLLLQNGMNLSTSEIIGTLVYKSGMVDMQYSYSTAVGLFQTIINVIILLTVNKIAGKLSETSLW